jgi:hypothetical protein
LPTPIQSDLAKATLKRDLQMDYVRIESVSVVKALHEFIEREAASGTSISAEAFWSGFADLLREFGPRNRELLQLRNELQSCIDQYHRERSGEPLDLGDYERFLRDIGYVLPEGNDFTIRTTKRPRVDRRRIFCPKNDHRTVLDKDNNEHRLKFSPCVTPKQESGGPADEAIERVKAVPGESRSTYKPSRGAAV